jgi:hypothetical protein
MHSARRFLLILSCAALSIAAANAQTVLFGNLNSSVKGYFPIGPIYASFSTGSSAVNLTDVKLQLEFLDGAPMGFSVGLYADSSTTPGGLIETIGSMNDSAISGNGAAYDFPVSPGIALAVNTRYWIGLSANNGEGSNTGWALTGSTSGTGDISSEFYCIELPQQTSEDRHSARPRGIPNGCYPNTNDPFVMQVTATPIATVPTLSFTGITLLSLLLAASAATFLRRSQPRES